MMIINDKLKNNMKAINFKLATFTFAAMLLASCSDSNSDGGTDIGKSTTVVGSAVEAQYANDLAGRVTNYKVNNTTASARKLISRAYSGPEVKVPTDAKNCLTILDMGGIFRQEAML